MSEGYKKSRKKGYAAVLKTAPAFTWGKSHERAINDPGPGPGEYNPAGDKYNKGIGFGSSTRYKITLDSSPGPGEYGVPRDPMMKSNPSFTFRGVQAKDPKAKLPGPGAYDSINPDCLSLRSSAPKISIAFKPDDPALREKKPGPQTYKVTLDRKPAVSMKFRHERVAIDPGPGPGAYSDREFIRSVYLPCSATKKGYSFGLKTTLKTTADQTPGPVYSIGCTTLGIAAAVPLTDEQIARVAVL